MSVSLEQKPEVQGALVAIDPSNGDVKALIGGYDFEQSKFDRATQAMRQTGSVFKPFVYTAAVDRGLKPDDIVVDARANFGGYAPGNYDGKFKGPITIRQALAESRNIPAVKTLAGRWNRKFNPLRSKVRNHIEDRSLPSHSPGFCRHHADGDDISLYNVPERWCACRT
jgi:membrane peptidoglycan carboxypeptidase